ncbi:hypothetical protein ACLB2K_015258 [Fragaria x ananassa]
MDDTIVWPRLLFIEHLSKNSSVEKEKKKKDEGDQEEGSGDEEEDLDLGSEIDDLKDPTTRRECIEDLSYLAREKGMSVKKGDEEAIPEMMIPYLWGSLSYSKRIQIFLKRVREHIDRCSTLDSLETVESGDRPPESGFQ